MRTWLWLGLGVLCGFFAQAFGDKAVLTTWEFDTTGCWVTLYSEENFRGDAVTIAGPRELPELDFPEWNGRVRSLEVGPNAGAVLFGGKNFQDQDFIFIGGYREPNLEHLPEWDRLESLKVTCRNTR